MDHEIREHRLDRGYGVLFQERYDGREKVYVFSERYRYWWGQRVVHDRPMTGTREFPIPEKSVEQHSRQSTLREGSPVVRGETRSRIGLYGGSWFRTLVPGTHERTSRWDETGSTLDFTLCFSGNMKEKDKSSSSSEKGIRVSTLTGLSIDFGRAQTQNEFRVSFMTDRW